MKIVIGDLKDNEKNVIAFQTDVGISVFELHLDPAGFYCCLLNERQLQEVIELTKHTAKKFDVQPTLRPHVNKADYDL
jgi:hypothetical protein